MLTIVLPAVIDGPPEVELRLEHSLVSLSKWESIHKKPFFGLADVEKTSEESRSYALQMLLDDFPPEEFLHRLTEEHIFTINEYINDKQSATWFAEEQQKGQRSSEVMTSELVYYWMVAFRIPFDAETWHFNRLMALIRICGIKQSSSSNKKMSKRSVAEQYRRLNEQRRRELGTSG